MIKISEKKVLVIGIDGASWNVLDLLIERGLMPNLESMKENGVWGNLKSCIPPVTYPAWRCYSTGKDPSQLGVYWWMNTNTKNKEFRINSSHSFKGKDIWDIIGEYGKKSIIINIPGTYPAKKINGILISGPPSPELEKAVYPPEFIQYLRNNGYKNFPKSKWSVEREKVLDEVKEIHKIQSKIALNLLKNEDWDFFHFTFFLTDPVMHYFWRYWDENHPLYHDNPFRSKVEKIWMELDYYIGKFIELLEDNSILIIMSDHGMTKLKSKIYLNRYLEEKGYLSIKFKYRIIRKILAILPVYSIGKMLSNVGTLDTIYNILLKFGLKHIIDTGAETQIEYRSIKWDDTKAFCLSDIYGLIYIIDKYNYNSQKIIEDLKALRDPNTGEPIFKEILNSRDVYTCIDDETPDLIAIPSEGYHISPSLAGTKIFDYSYEPWSATHSQNGIFLAFGKDIKKGRVDCSIYDLAPTILHILDIPIPTYMKGKVLKNIFREDSNLYYKKIRYCNSEKERILTRIKKLKSMKKL